MEEFNLEINKANIINKFNQVSLNGTKSILEWFYMAISYRSLFTGEYANVIYNKLRELGYREVNNKIEELECFKSLMQKSSEYDGEKIGYNLISLILKNLKEDTGLTPSIEQFIAIYNEIYNKENTFDTMMKKLNSSIGEDIVFVIIKNGKVALLTGVLDSVEDYSSVTIDGIKYPFIGYQVEINKITKSDGTTLFSNSLSSTSDVLEEVNIIEKKNIDLFGNKYNKELKRIS